MENKCVELYLPCSAELYPNGFFPPLLSVFRLFAVTAVPARLPSCSSVSRQAIGSAPTYTSSGGADWSSSDITSENILAVATRKWILRRLFTERQGLGSSSRRRRRFRRICGRSRVIVVTSLMRARSAGSLERAGSRRFIYDRLRRGYAYAKRIKPMLVPIEIQQGGCSIKGRAGKRHRPASLLYPRQ